MPRDAPPVAYPRAPAVDSATRDTEEETLAAPQQRASQGEAGGIVTGWLLRLVVFVAVLAFVVFEVGAVAVNTVTVDDASREVARAASLAYRTGTIEDARDAGVDIAADRGVEFVEVVVDGDELTVSVRAEAQTIAIHQIEAFDRFTVRETTTTVSWR